MKTINHTNGQSRNDVVAPRSPAILLDQSKPIEVVDRNFGLNRALDAGNRHNIFTIGKTPRRQSSKPISVVEIQTGGTGRPERINTTAPELFAEGSHNR